MKFKPFLDVERLEKEDVEGILVGSCTIFPKLDGTNASVWSENDKIMCGSRKRILSLGKLDNLGFCDYIQNNLKDILYNFFKKFPEYRLYGEFLKPHSLKDYRDEMWNRFWIFDIFNGKYLDYKEYLPLISDYNLDYIPPYAIIENPSIEQLQSIIETNTFGMKEGFLGEGIVIKNYSYKNKYGRLAYGKIVRNEFKDMNKKVFGPSIIKGPGTDEKLFTDIYITKGRTDKLLAKLGSLERHILISRFLNTLFYEAINEEMYDFFKGKSKIINSSLLRQYIYNKAKELNPQIF